MKKLILLCILGIFLSFDLSAQIDTTYDYIDLSLEQLMNVEVVSASQQSEPLTEVPVPVSVITEGMIEASGATNIQELLIRVRP